MRLLLASYYYPPSIGGIERQTWLLAHGLAERGHCVRVLCARLASNEPAEVQEAPGLTVERVHPGRGGRLRRMATYLSGLLGATARHRRYVDLLHVQQILYPAAAMVVAARALRRPLIVTNHGSGPSGGVQTMRHQPGGQLCLRLLSRAAIGVSLSQEMTREMRSAGFERIVQIPNGVPIPAEPTDEQRARARQALGVSGKVALYIGRLNPEKGVDVLARAWATLNEPDATLLIVGAGPLARPIKDLIATSARVDFRPPTPDVQPYLAAADVFVLPSRAEGLSYGLLEAMAYGLPIVATSVGGNREVIDRPDLGVLVPPEDAAALAAAIRAVLLDGALASQLRRSGRAHVRERYSADAMIDAYERLYLDAVAL